MAKAPSKNPLTEYKRIRADLERGIYKPCYLLMGEEPYYVDQLSKYIAEHALPEDQQAFNQMIMYGNAVTAAQVIDNARRYPMMAERQVVVVREAQQMKGLELFTHYFKQPNPTTVLVLCFRGKSVDKRQAFWKAAQPVCEILESTPLREDATSAWIVQYLKDRKTSIDAQAAVLLADFLGTDLSRIVMELDKLFLLLPEGTSQITVEMVEQSVGVNREFSPFALTKYLSEKNFAKVQPIAQYFGDNAKTYPLVMLLSLLYAHFARILKYHCVRMEQPTIPHGALAEQLGISPFFMKEVEIGARNYSFRDTVDIINLICYYDSRYKSSDRGEATDGELLMEFICRIMA